MNLSKLGLLIGLILISTLAMAQEQKALSEIENIINKDYKVYYNLYTYLHQNPELSFQEKNTSKRIAEELKKAGFKVTKNFGGNGVVGVLKNGPGPVLLIRTDMDALPIKEETSLPYSSTIKMIDVEGDEVPVMHACGHDVHMSVFVGTANTLAKLKKEWKGTLIMIAQQAEERSGGAKSMIDAGLFSKFPVPDYGLALHVSPTIEAGKVGINSGPFFASTDMVDLTVYGIGGHGAIPQNAIDPIVLSARMITAFQTIISREISPLETALLTVGSIHGGSKHNIIPDRVDLELTIRAYSDETRDKIIEGLKRISRGIAISAGLTEDKYPTVTIRNESAPALINDTSLTNELKVAFTEALGKENVEIVKPVMAAEDFAMYGRTKENVPICLFWLGTVSKEKMKAKAEKKIELPGLHSAFFSPEPESSIKTGIKAMSSAAIHLFLKK